MKYLVLLCDGMADYPCEKLDGKTPMQAMLLISLLWDTIRKFIMPDVLR